MHPEWRPLDVISETLPENLENVIFEDPSIVLAGLGIRNLSIFCYLVVFLELHLLMLLGARFGDFGLPIGTQWEPPLGPKLDFWGVIF